VDEIYEFRSIFRNSSDRLSLQRPTMMPDPCRIENDEDSGKTRVQGFVIAKAGATTAHPGGGEALERAKLPSAGGSLQLQEHFS